MTTLCVNGNQTDLVTAETIDSIQLEHEDKYLCLDDFDLYFTKDNDNFRQVCDQICIPGPDRFLNFTWLEKHFGYGPTASSHPDQLTFRKPINDAGKLLPGDKFRAFPKRQLRQLLATLQTELQTELQTDSRHCFESANCRTFAGYNRSNPVRHNE